MPITIQEIIASDTISQLVDKTNFNFDQILLNGGGPAGPAGPIGPVGPAGGRGAKGTTWYDGADDPNTTPPTATPLSGDYYLRDSNSNPPLATDGDVWEYTGLTWSPTGINLTGPTGPQGQSGGFGLRFGGPTNILEETALYNGVIGYGLTGGATSDNQGIPSIMVGGAVSTTPSGAFTLDNDYIIPDAVSKELQSFRASLLVHQKNATSKSIVFHGGYGPTAALDDFWQGNLALLSNISLGKDDRLRMDVPKAATNPVVIDDLIGYEVFVPQRGQQYTAGKQISFVTGTDAAASGFGNDANFTIEVREGSNVAGNKFETIVNGAAAQSKMQLGTSFPIPNTQNNNIGDFNLEAGRVNIVTSDFGGAPGNIRMLSAGTILLDTTFAGGTGAIQAKTLTGSILLETSSGGNNGNITIRQGSNSGNAEGNIAIDNFSVGPAGTGVSGTSNILIRGNRELKMQKQSAGTVGDVLAAPSITIDWGDTTPHTRRVGQQTWGATGYVATINPLSTKVQRYYDTSSPLASQPGQVITQYGKNFNSPMSVDAVFMKFINHDAPQSFALAPTIQIKRGPTTNGLIQISSQQDNPAGLAGFDEWWSLSQNKAMFAIPTVQSRSSVYGENASGYVDPPVGSSAQDSISVYRWDTRSANAMPVNLISKLNQPFIDVTIAPGANLDSVPGGTVQNNTNYQYELLMPWESVEGSGEPVEAGSTYYIDINHGSARYQEPIVPSGYNTHNYYGTILFKVPVMRAKKANQANWQPWVYQDYYIFVPQGMYGTSNNATYVARLAGSLTWNGGISERKGAAYSAASGQGSRTMQVQMGWSTGALPNNVIIKNMAGSFMT